jgi:hypothetical protein
VNNSENFLQLEIAQSRTFPTIDSTHQNENLPVTYTASNDSIAVTNFTICKPKIYNVTKNRLKNHPVQTDDDKSLVTENQPDKKISETKGLRIFFPTIILLASIAVVVTYEAIWLGLIGIAIAVILFLMLNTNILGFSQSKRQSKSKIWQILVSFLILLMGMIFIILAPTEMLFFASIVFVVIALMLLILAIINNLFPAKTKPNLTMEQKRDSPFNKWALWAGIFFLIFLTSTITLLINFVPYLYILVYLSFIIAFILSIIALLNMSRKSNYERGKVPSILILIITLIPILLIISFIGEELVDDIL